MATYYLSPIGWFKIQEVDGFITWVGMVHQAEHDYSSTPLEQEAVHQLTAYFNGTLKQFEVPYTLGNLSLFANNVFSLLLECVTYGTTITYSQLASLVNSAGAMRAVGRAMSSNPVSIIVPCHRVVASKNAGGYAWSLSNKIWLLEHESRYKDSSV